VELLNPEKSVELLFYMTSHGCSKFFKQRLNKILEIFKSFTMEGVLLFPTFLIIDSKKVKFSVYCVSEKVLFVQCGTLFLKCTKLLTNY